MVSLSIVTSFYTPLSEVSSLSSYDIGYIMLAIGMAFSGVVSYWGVQNKWNFEKSANRVVHNYLFRCAFIAVRSKVTTTCTQTATVISMTPVGSAESLDR